MGCSKTIRTRATDRLSSAGENFKGRNQFRPRSLLPFLFSPVSGICYPENDIAYLHAARNKTPIIEQMSEVYWTLSLSLSFFSPPFPVFLSCEALGEAKYVKCSAEKFQCRAAYLKYYFFHVRWCGKSYVLLLSLVTRDVSFHFTRRNFLFSCLPSINGFWRASARDDREEQGSRAIKSLNQLTFEVSFICNETRNSDPLSFYPFRILETRQLA